MLKSKGEASVLRKSGRFFTLEIHCSHGRKFPHGARRAQCAEILYRTRQRRTGRLSPTPSGEQMQAVRLAAPPPASYCTTW